MSASHHPTRHDTCVNIERKSSEKLRARIAAAPATERAELDSKGAAEPTHAFHSMMKETLPSSGGLSPVSAR